MTSARLCRATILCFVVLVVINGIAAGQAPSITGLSVTQGDAGTSVTISGLNFGTAGTVTFNGTTATPTLYTPTSITVPVPNNATTGNVVVTVQISGLNYPSNGIWFTVTWSAPTVSLSPTSGPIGTPVTISGNNFGPTQENSTVTFNGTPAVVTSWSSTSISTSVPNGATTGPVSVTVDGQSSQANFTVNLPVPNITGISPTGAPVNTSVTISGSNFGSGTSSSVSFNGTNGTATNWTNSAITVPVPSGASSGNVVVTVSGEASNQVYFTVLSATAPEVTGFSVPSATTGTSITVQGKNFGSSGTVTFNGTQGTPTNWTATAITVPVPSAATTGPVVVTVSSVASNPTTFTVLPQITSISPTSGTSTTVVKVNGTGFGTTVGSSTLTLNGVVCTPTLWSDTQVITEINTCDPITGPMVVTVGGTPSNGATFTLNFNGTIGGTVTNVASGTGISGATVKAYAGGALIATGTTGSTGAYTLSDIASGTYTLTFSASGFTPQSIGNISLQQGGSTTVSTSLGTPSITAIVPTSGPTGTLVTITGSSFGATQVSGSNATFNGTAAKITTWSNTQIVATVPSSATTGAVAVKVGGVQGTGPTFTVGSGTISGTVTAASGGGAINGASVKALQAGVVIGSATSSSTGAYSITTLVPGTYDVIATASTYGDLIKTGNAVTAGGTTTVNLALPAAGTIAGTITQSNGTTGISGATVGAYQGYDAAGTATANTSGAYSISGLSAGSYTVTASASGYNPQSVNGVTVTSGNTTTENISLPTQSVISFEYDQAGRLAAVVNSTGNAAAYNYDAAGNISSIAQNSASKVTITDFIPNNGPVANVVTIYGTGFSTTSSQNAVKFNGTSATVTSSTATQIVTKVPNLATTGTISVTSPGGSATSTQTFTVTSSSGLPSILSFTPTIGTVSTPVTITGTNYNTTPSKDGATFNGTPSVVTAATATTLSTTVPGGGTSGHITVSNGIGNATSTADFFVPPSPFTASQVVFTGRMTLGGTGAVNITTANDIGLMLFDGTAGEGASLTLANSGFSSFTATIIAPGGQQLTTGNTNSSSLYLEVISLPVTGTYTIMVQGASTGTANITSYVIPANVLKTIAIGGAAVNVATTTPGQNIDLTFTGSVTQQVTLYLSAVTYTGCNSLNVTIYNPDNSVLATGGLCNGTTLYVDAPPLAQSGTYTIFIDPQGSTTGGLTAQLDNATATTAKITEGGSAVTVTIAQPGQQGNLSFSGKQGDRVSLLLSNVTIPSSNVYIQNSAALTAGTKYNIEMDYFQGTGPSLAQLWYSSPSTPLQIIPTTALYTPGGAQGLQGDYFTDTLLQGYPQVRRTDPNVNFNWTNTSPDPSIPEYNFGVRWTGSFEAQYSENYSFCTLTDDGARFFINGQIVVNEWVSQSATQWCSNNLASTSVGTGGAYIDVITLPADGTYNILLAPQNNGVGNMTFTLYKVPADFSGTISPGGSTTVTTTVPGQNASLTLQANAGQRLSLSMSAVSIQNSNVAVLNSASLTAGQQYPIQMQYFQGGSGASAELLWFSNSTVKDPIPASQLYPSGSQTAGGLSASYYPNSLLEGGPAVTRVDPGINFNWNSQGPDPVIPQQSFSANWVGSVQAVYSENYTICTITDDGSRLYLNNSLVISDWQSQAATQYCSTDLATANGVGTGGAYVDDFIAPVQGTYTITIDPQGNDIGSMTLTLNNVPTDFSSPITPGGSAVNVQTTVPGQNAALTFQGSAGQRVSLLMAPGTIGSSNVSVVNTGAPFSAGQEVPVEMEYFQGTGGSTAQLWYYSPSTVKQVIPPSQLYPPNSSSPGGLQGNYFNNEILGGTPSLVRTDPDVNFNWNGNPPDPTIIGNCNTPGQCFSTRWLGSIGIQKNEVYTFCTTTDDGSLLWINSSQMVNDWQSQGATEYCGGTWGATNIGTGGGFIDTITLPATGTYTIPIDPQGSDTGSMQFTLYNVPPDVTGPLTINGTAQNVSITTPGQNAEYTFGGSANQLLTVHITNNNMNPVLVSLFNPDGTLATSTQSGSSSFNLTQQTLGTNGTYTVKIDPQGSVTGSLSVQVTSP